MKKIVCLLSVILSVFLIGGCGQQEAKSEEQLGELTIGLMPDTNSLPFIIAQEKGYFKEEGVKVNLQQFKSAMDRDAALQSGNIEGAVSDLLAVAFAKDGGFDVKVTSATDGTFKLVGGKELETADVTALKGKDVAVSKNTIVEYVTDQILAANHMSPDSINKVVIPQIPTRLEMLQNGKLAGATMPEPMGSIAIANGCKNIISSDDLGINPGVLMFTAKSAQDKQEAIKAMYRAYNKAVDYLNTADRSEYIDLVVEKGGFPPTAKEALVLPKYRKAVLPTDKDVADCMNWLFAKQLVKTNYSYQDIVADILK